jgi:streptogramin lyase
MGHRFTAFLRFLSCSMLLFATLLVTSIASAQTITEHSITTTSSGTVYLAVGPDNDIWFSETTPAKIGKLSRTSGAITEYALTPATVQPRGLVSGPDSKIWFVTGVGDTVHTITTDGTVAQVKALTDNDAPEQIISAGGVLWFTASGGNYIGKLTTAGELTKFAAPSGETALSEPYGIVEGPDGNIWFTERTGNKIGKITSAGTIIRYSLPTLTSLPEYIVAGRDQNLWVALTGANKVAKITTSGVVTEYSMTSGAGVASLVKDVAGLPFFVLQETANSIGRLSPTGTAGTSTPITSTNTGLGQIVYHPVVHKYYFAATSSNKIGVFTPESRLGFAVTSLENGVKDESYSESVSGQNGTPPYTFVLASGLLPAGLTLASDGTISGTPTESGTFPFALKLTDASGLTNTAIFGLEIDPGTQADLYPTGLRARKKGSKVSGAYRVGNSGLRDASAFRVDVYASHDEKLTRRDRKVATKRFTGLTAGAESRASTFSYSRRTAKEKFVLVCVDCGDEVDESAETSNTTYVRVK